MRTAETFEARVQVTRDDQSVAGTSILGLMLLGAGPVPCSPCRRKAPMPRRALAALGDLIERGFDE